MLRKVIENGQLLLIDEDLLFFDNDIDTRPEDIRYSHHALPNGELVYAIGQGMVAVLDVFLPGVDIVINKQQIFISQ